MAARKRRDERPRYQLNLTAEQLEAVEVALTPGDKTTEAQEHLIIGVMLIIGEIRQDIQDAANRRRGLGG